MRMRNYPISALLPSFVSRGGVCTIKTEIEMNVDHEVTLLVEEIQRLGSTDADGNFSVTFGILFSDDRCANIFEALVGTLRAAKRKKIVSYDGELLLQGVHDNVPIKLLKN